MVLVSVVIPTFGRPELVCRAVRSALGQTMRELEVVVVIDGDDPATLAALETIDDPRLRHLSQPQKRGAGHARDTGAAASRGEWVAFLDDDDEWLPEKLQRQLAQAEAHGGPAIVMSVSRVVSRFATHQRPETIYDNRQPIDEWLFDRDSFTKARGSFLQTSSLLFPRQLLDRLRFADARHEEWELAIRAVKQEHHALLTDPEPSVIYYIPEKRKALSLAYTWHPSLDWALANRALLTRRAFSGFCLTIAGEMAAGERDWSAVPKLLAAAFRHGAPTAQQLTAFFLYWFFPSTLRRRLRALKPALTRS